MEHKETRATTSQAQRPRVPRAQARFATRHVDDLRNGRREAPIRTGSGDLEKETGYHYLAHVQAGARGSREAHTVKFARYLYAREPLICAPRVLSSAAAARTPRTPRESVRSFTYLHFFQQVSLTPDPTAAYEPGHKEAAST